MKKEFKFFWLLFFLPFLIGTYGYSLLYDGNIISAAYSAIRLYVIELDVPYDTINLYIEIARWTAFIAITTAAVALLKHIISAIGLRRKLMNPDLIIVHGDGARKELVIKALGGNAIGMTDNACFKAPQHILAFETDAAAIQYLSEH